MRRRVIEAQFNKSTKCPDGRMKDSVNATPRADLHTDRWDPYSLEWDTEERGLYIKVIRGDSIGKETLVLGCHSIQFEQEAQPEIGKGKAGPGRGHTGKMQPEAV